MFTCAHTASIVYNDNVMHNGINDVALNTPSLNNSLTVGSMGNIVSLLYLNDIKKPRTYVLGFCF